MNISVPDVVCDVKNILYVFLPSAAGYRGTFAQSAINKTN
jgi:hypothetical protein